MNNERQARFDDVIRKKLREMPVPVGLKTRILANAKVESRSKVWTWLTLAVALLITVAAVFWLRPTGFAAYRGEMAQFVSAKYDLDLHSESFDELRQNFAKNGFPSDYVMPPGLKGIAVEGGCLRQWHGHKVALVCMEAKDHDVWLFVAESQDVPAPTPGFVKDGKITTASWTAGHLTYLLATEGDEAELRRYLSMP